METQLDLFTAMTNEEQIKIEEKDKKRKKTTTKNKIHDNTEKETLKTIETETEIVIVETRVTEEPPIYFRQVASVQVDDKVKIVRPIDNSAESEGYYSYHNDKKGTVVMIEENKNPKNDLYQFSVTTIFADGETGVFYDLELEVLE